MTEYAPAATGSNTRASGRLLLGLIAGLLGGVLVTSVAAIGLFRHRIETVRADPAPDGTNAAAVVRVHSPMDIDTYEVWLGRFSGGEVPRGHVVPIPLGWGTEPRVDWTPDTVVLHFEPGGEIRVPMTMVLDTR
ncbi:hypothetical protein KHQ06_30180 [Nocardia tengchongensis]|uniref:DUF3592 domain-containing protein n=1 Tax=Nocardia tengchongensis TaxID=2055889 RepID=A0ABX8CK96_9NOCA|nr:hypothetical protein [Nocardia tengchongensis]QVI20403.1 hypothetical protein KHQ06_30180 [Nocardia tengchongensis]